MTLKNAVLSTLLAGVFTIGGLYAKRRVIDPYFKPVSIEKTTQVQPLQNGDIIFQSSLSPQCKAIQLATHSPYSHCGIIFEKDNQWYVYEALQPVTVTPMKEWTARGDKGHYVIKRLKNANEVLTPAVLAKMYKIGEGYLGKNYDLYFEWSDDRIYCSELVWKIYKEGTGLEVGKLQKMKEFDLSHELVKQKLKERYGNKVPMEEKVISPASMFDSELLTTVAEK